MRVFVASYVAYVGVVVFLQEPIWSQSNIKQLIIEEVQALSRYVAAKNLQRTKANRLIAIVPTYEIYHIVALASNLIWSQSSIERCAGGLYRYTINN